MDRYRIRAVAQMTGMSPALLRAWEARYGLVRPSRTASGYRLYSDQDVALFRGAQRLVQQGISPMQVARLPRSKLLEADQPPPALPAQEPPSPLRSYSELLERALAAIAAFDSERAEELISLPLLLLKPEEACRGFLVPLLREIGERWHRKELAVAAEHFGTALVRSKLILLLDTLRARSAMHRVLCACPPGELHELGLLVFAVEAAVQGFELIYLGANVPLPDLAHATQETRPSLVATSVVMQHEPDVLGRLLAAMKAAVGKGCPLLVGGHAVLGQEKIVQAADCVTLPSSRRLVDLLTSSSARAVRASLTEA